MQKIKENCDLIAIAAILLAFVLLFIWIKIYPTIEDPLIEYPEETSVLIIDLFEDGERAESWYRGEHITEDMEKAIIEILFSAETKKSFDADKGQSLDDVRYCIMLVDGDKSKTIWFGVENICHVDNEEFYDIIDSDGIIAELDALFTAT